MRRSLLTLFLLLLPEFLAAQTDVDKLIRTLDSLTITSLNEWKMSPDLKSYRPSGDPTQPSFDDRSWDILRLGESVYPDSCWLRNELIVPDRILGRKPAGALRLLLSLDDYGYLWVNGKSLGHFPWNGDFVISPSVTPGDRFVLAIKAVNTGGPLRLLRAEIEMESIRPLKGVLADFALSLRVGQKLLSFDTYQTSSSKRFDPGLDRSMHDREEKRRLNALLQTTAAGFHPRIILEGTLPELETALVETYAKLQPVRTFVQRFTLYFNSNAHIDAAWLWREKETIEVCRKTFASVINMFEARPDFTYTQSTAAYYDWMERLYPDLFRRIQQRVKDGRWEVVGGTWVEPDCNLPSGESWNRHLLYAKRYFKEKLGVDVRIGWNPDSFGYNWNMPMFYRQAGIEAFITQKIGWNETNVFPHRLFWWQAPDESRILAYFPFDYVNEITNPYQLVDWLRQFEANTGFTTMMVLFGVGDHGGGPSLEMMARIDRLKQLAIFPTIRFGNTQTYLDELRRRDLSALPVWNDELYLEYHQGTYTTQAKMKELNRHSELLLTNAEKFSTLALLFGGTYDRAALEEAWRKALFNQFHDILPGSSIREVHIDALETYNELIEIGSFEMQKAVGTIAGRVHTSEIRKGIPLIVFNPLAWDRTDLVSFELPKGDTSSYSVFDPEGKELPSQTVSTGRYTRTLLFMAQNVPSLGYRTFEMRRQRPSNPSSDLKMTQTSLENSFFRVEIDPESGWVRSIIDKRVGREVLAGPANRLQLLADYPKAWDAWNIGLTGEEYPSNFRRIEIVETGPVRAVLRVYRDYLKPGVKKSYPTEDFPTSFFTQDIILLRETDRIDFRTEVDWWEEKTMLKVAFPLTVQDTIATYEIPYGTIQRSTQLRNSWEQAKVEVPAQRWADVSRSDYGVSLLNRAKYGYDIKGNTMRLSLLRSPIWPDRTADRGKHSIEYSLYPHKGTWREGRTVRRGYEYNSPLIAVAAIRQRGSEPPAKSFVRLEPSSLVLTSMKKAEDSDAWVIQWYESEGKDVEAHLTAPRTIKRAVLSNFLEDDVREIVSSGKQVRISTKPRSVVTVKVTF
jgi:alpha-mannosidase